MEMTKFVEYRGVQRKKDIKSYTDIYKNSGVDNLISVVKQTGITINFYEEPPKNQELVNGLTLELKKVLSKDDMVKWNLLISESSIINDLYITFFNSNHYLCTKGADPNEEVSAFLMILEKFLFYISNIVHGKEQKNRSLSFQFNVDVAYDTTSENKVQKYSKIFDHSSYIANDVLCYLMFYKYKNTQISFTVTNKSLSAAFNHLINTDRKDILNSIVKEWQFGARNIKKINSESCNSKLLNNLVLDYSISMDRLEHRKHTIQSDISLFDTHKKNPNEFSIEDDESYTKEYLKTIFNGYDDNYSCKIEKENYTYKMDIATLIRAYELLKKLAFDFVKKSQDIDSPNLDKVCLLINKDKLISEYLANNISSKSIEDLLEILSYGKQRDLYDTPLIDIGSTFIIIPSIVVNLDVPQVVLSTVNQFDFRGHLFENSIVSILKDKSINCVTKEYKDTSGEYQCDVFFVLGHDLFICECKAWGEVHSIKGFYDQINKCEDAKKQLDRIYDKYIKNLSWVKKSLNYHGEFRSTNKLVIVANALGFCNTIADTYFIDYSCLSRFILRNKPSLNLIQDKVIYKYNIPKYTEYDGSITYNKMLRLLEHPAPIELAQRMTKKIKSEIPIGKTILTYESFKKEIQYFNYEAMQTDRAMEMIEKCYNLKK